jgi:class 3 adenylate cyclase/pimeloyl-ACP methyl ester carboxylesterase
VKTPPKERYARNGPIHRPYQVLGSRGRVGERKRCRAQAGGAVLTAIDSLQPQSRRAIREVWGQDVSPPEIRYTRSGSVALAYQVTGEGPIDMVFVPGWISNIEMAWELPEFARFLSRLASFTRLIWFDKRGTGLSDRIAGPVTLEERSDDIRAVMDAAGSDRAALVGWYEGGAIAAGFAATYPQRVSALVIGSFTARAAHDAGEPWGIDPGMMAVITERAEDAWGTGAIAELVSPTTAGNARFLTFWRRYERASASPNAAGTMIRWNLAIDVRAILPVISSPTLVIHRKDVRLVPATAVRHVASQIPGSRYLELDGQDMFPFVGDSEAILDAIQEFVTGAPPPAEADRLLATLLFTDVVGSTQTISKIGDRAWGDLLQAHRQAARRSLERFGGREVDTAGDGLFAVFDGPARALRCAAEIRDQAAEIGLALRLGLHTGEVRFHGQEVLGMAVHVAARVSALAEASQILATSTVKDLVLGSGIGFAKHRTTALKGVPGSWQLYELTHN